MDIDKWHKKKKQKTKRDQDKVNEKMRAQRKEGRTVKAGAAAAFRAAGRAPARTVEKARTAGMGLAAAARAFRARDLGMAMMS